MTTSCDDASLRDDENPRRRSTTTATTTFTDPTLVASSHANIGCDVITEDDVEPAPYVCTSRSHSGLTQQQDDHCTADVVTTAAATDSDDDDDDDDVSDNVYTRPDRPDCVPKIDLSWTTDDEQKFTRHRTTHTSDHVTPLRRRHPLRHQSRHHQTVNTSNTAAVELRRSRHVIQDGGQTEVAVKRRRHRRQRRARCNVERYRYHYATSVIRPTSTLPRTPRAPREQTVHYLDIPETENDARKHELEITRTESVEVNDDCVCGSKNAFYCNTTMTNRRSHDVISARDVTVNTACNAGMLDYGSDIPIPPARTMAATHPTDDVNICQTGSSNVYVGAEGLNDDCVSPPTFMNNPQTSAASEIVRRDGGDAVQVDSKSESESSASLVERLRCASDCCCCCLLTITLYRSRPKQ